MNHSVKKSFIFFVFILLYPGALHAQYHLISFTASGQSTMLDSIQVENLTQGTTLSLVGDDDLLLYGTVGTNTLSSNENVLKVYPNPTISLTTVEFFQSKTQTVSLEVYNDLGVLIAKEKSRVQSGQQKFTISGLKTGIYMIGVQSGDQLFASRVISTGTGRSNVEIFYLGLEKESGLEKTAVGTEEVVHMQYNHDDWVLFKGFSGSYVRVITLLPTQSQTVNFEFVTCMDGDENHYAVVSIGSQTWMAENLRTTKYNDGTYLPVIIDDSLWSSLSTPACCWYDNDSATYATPYGALYNWYAVDTGIICPTGWHVPDQVEWTSLANYLGSITVAGGKLKETGTAHWNSPNTGANNRSGFTALPGGDRYIDGLYDLMGESGFWWTSSAISSSTAWGFYMHYDEMSAWDGYGYFPTGVSVRCLKDEDK